MRPALLLVLLLLAGCQNDHRALPQGSYAGSSADRQAVTVDVGGGKVFVNGLETKAGARDSFVQKKAPRISVRCHTAPRRELVCVVTRAGRSETVELLRL
jgi:hypothetical protein